jgi:signal peptide peptidase SppA
MKNFAHIAARAYNQPLLLNPAYAGFLFSYLNSRVGFNSMITASGEELDKDGMANLAGSYKPRSMVQPVENDAASYYYAVTDGVAIVSIDGSLMHKSGYIGASSGAMGYDGIAAQIDSANANPNVRGILLDVNSPGGEVAGCQALAEKIKASAKPVWAIANEQAASAAYWIASSASRLLITDTAEVGSIGVLTAHADYSNQLEADGIKVTLIFAGAHKVDGNPYEALPEAVRTEFQAEINALREKFAGAVAANRGKTVGAVLGTEARMYRGQAAVDNKLADAVMSYDQTLAEFKSFLTAGKGRKGGSSMTTSQAGLTGDTITTAEATALVAAESVTARKAGAVEERTRISAILTHAEAEGRAEQAQVLALTEGLSAETAGALLATMPKGTVNAAALAAVTQAAGVAAEAGEKTTEGNAALVLKAFKTLNGGK